MMLFKTIHLCYFKTGVSPKDLFTSNLNLDNIWHNFTNTNILCRSFSLGVSFYPEKKTTHTENPPFQKCRPRSILWFFFRRQSFPQHPLIGLLPQTAPWTKPIRLEQNTHESCGEVSGGKRSPKSPWWSWLLFLRNGKVNQQMILASPTWTSW